MARSITYAEEPYAANTIRMPVMRPSSGRIADGVGLKFPGLEICDTSEDHLLAGANPTGNLDASLDVRKSTLVSDVEKFLEKDRDNEQPLLGDKEYEFESVDLSAAANSSRAAVLDLTPEEEAQALVDAGRLFKKINIHGKDKLDYSDLKEYVLRVYSIA